MIEYKMFYKGDVTDKWVTHYFNAENDFVALQKAGAWAAEYSLKQYGLEKIVTTRLL